MEQRDLPSGEVTFLFTDIEGSTRLLHELGDRYADVLLEQRRILRHAFAEHGGSEVDTQGDSFFVAFGDAARAVAAAAASQAALAAEPWPSDVAVRVRMGVHTGEPLLADGHYVGIDVHRAARIAAAAHGGQVLISERTSRLLAGNGSTPLRSLGDHRLKDLPQPEHLFQLLVDGLPSTFPPPRAHEDALEAAGLPDYSLPPADVPCPYKGLAAFGPEDSELFFGREPLVEDLVGRLEAEPFLGVVGPSGSGKSSIARAGLVPALEHRAARELRTAIITPGPGPVQALAGTSEAGLLVVDQFEELFTLCRDAREQAAFMDALGARADDGTRVVIVLRADFYGHCASFPRLAALLERRHALVGPMTEEELRRAIELPAQRAGLLLEPGVVEGVLRDVVGEPGALPLLSHSLLETWRRRSGRMLTLIGYLQSGGVRGAVAQTAESVYRNALSPDEQRLARNIFLRLTEVGDGTEDTRRRATVAELTPRAGQEPVVGEVLQRLAEARLITIGEGTVEVAHEALIRHWPTLQSWLDDDREGRLAHRRLTEAAQEWHALGRDPSGLLRGTRLATIGDWATEHDAELNDLEREYLIASRQGAQHEADRQRRTNRRLRSLLAGALVLLAAALVAGGLALLQQRRAEDAAEEANSQRLGALALVEKRPDTAVLLAVEATRLDASPETKGALFDTLMKYGRALRVARTQERILRVTAPMRGGTVALSDNSGHLLLYDARTLALRRRVTLPFIEDAAFAPDGRTVYVVGFLRDDPRVQALRAVDAASGRVRWRRRVPAGERGLVVTADGRHVGWAADGVVVVHDTRTGRETARMALRKPRTALPLARGRALVLDARSATVVDLNSRRSLRRFRLPGGARRTSSAVAPDGSRAAIGRADGTIDVVRLDSGRVVRMQDRHDGQVESIAFSPDDSVLASAGDPDGRVLVWDPRSGERTDVLAGHGGGLRALAFSEGGRTLVSSGLDSTIVAWDLAGGRAMLRTFDRPGPPCIDDACYFPQFSISPDGSALAIEGPDHRIRFVDTNRLAPAGALPRRALACCEEAAFSPDGRTVATAWIEPNGISLWNRHTGALERRLFTSHEPWREEDHAPPLDTVAYAPDGGSVATNENEVVHLLDPADGDRLARLVAFDFVQWLAYSPDGRLLEAATDNGGVTVWDVRSRRRLWSRRIDNQNTLGGAFSPDGELLLVGGESGRIHLLEARTGRAVRAPLLAHSAYLGSLAFAPDGGTFASAGTDGRTILWDTESERALGSPFDARASSWARFSPDGDVLYVLSTERGYALDASLSAWQSRACSIAGRPLTRGEWARYIGGRDYLPACAPASVPRGGVGD